MEMKEVYEKLEQMEGGAELITAIKSEVSKLNGEAKTNRGICQVFCVNSFLKHQKLNFLRQPLDLPA